MVIEEPLRNMSHMDNNSRRRFTEVVNEGFVHDDSASGGEQNQCTSSVSALETKLENKTESARQVITIAVEAESPGDLERPDTERFGQDETPESDSAWMVAVGASLIMMLTDMLLYCFSLIFFPLFLELGTSSSTNSWLLDIMAAISCISGMMTGPLVKRFRWRKVALVCSLLIFFACIISSFATSALFLLFSFSTLAGVSCGIVNNLCLLIIPHYFKQKRGVANAFMKAGTCIGQMVGPILISSVHDEFGFIGGTFIVGAVVLHCCVGASLFRPIQVHTRLRQDSTKTKDWEQSAKNTENTVYKSTCKVLTEAFVSICHDVVANLSILKSLRAIIIALGGMLFNNATIKFLTLVPFEVEAAGHPGQVTNWHFTVSAVCNLVARLVVCLLSDFSRFSMQVCFMTSAAITTLAILAYSVVADTWWQTLIMGAFGCGVGGNFGIFNLAVAYFMGLDDMAPTMGATLLLRGLCFVTIGPCIGMIRDASGSYAVSMWVLAGMTGGSFTVWVFLPAAVRYDHNKNHKHLPSPQ
ncbi:monocarboxylate transporter 12-like [Homarus americanus]|uniref:Monocarboxylate transporter 12-like 7 n=1 Tax=Homarus americanus TaxID=6706 RepID=A0A8J5JFG6_HOMAM|nr:monocarboxylate transporter 12-like [Homarus americanus]KAG7155684.1 Monocarboxylate transporter 12-like 7 [Homarus americanus]